MEVTRENLPYFLDKCSNKSILTSRLVCSKDLLMDSFTIITGGLSHSDKLLAYAYMIDLFEYYDEIFYEKKINSSIPKLFYEYRQIKDKTLAKKYINFVFDDLFPHIEKILKEQSVNLDINLFPKFQK